MDKYTKKGLLMATLLLFYSLGISTSIVSITFDLVYMLQAGHVTLNVFFDIFVQVTYVVLNGYIILFVHERLFEKRERSQERFKR